ncbi:MAG TPA: hypothetical protein VGC39_00460 [Candidatus Methylacidiphilales bacterium]
MNVRFLLSNQHSGGDFLKTFIESRFPSVICSGEVLAEPVAFARQLPALSDHPELPHFWLWYELEAATRSISVSPDRRIEAFEAYLLKLGALARPKDPVIDLKYNGIRSLSGYADTEYDSNDFATFVADRQIPLLHLIQRNTLQVILAQKRAHQAALWPHQDRSTNEPLPRIRLSPPEVLSEIRYLTSLTQDYQKRFNSYPGYEEVNYEDLAREQDHPEIGVNLHTLVHFLERKAAAPSVTTLPFKKATQEDPSDAVENWGEIVRVLEATEYEWMVQNPLLAAA